MQQLLTALSAGGEGAMEELELTPEEFAKIEVELLKAVLNRSNTMVCSMSGGPCHMHVTCMSISGCLNT